MKRIYIAGAYSADNVIDVLKNIGRGEIVSAEVFRSGYAPFCPWHDKDFIIKHPDFDYKVDMFYKYSISWLEVSDAMLLVPFWSNSVGTIKEIEFCTENKIPVFESLEYLKIKIPC
jgi:hypothetical protein